MRNVVSSNRRRRTPRLLQNSTDKRDTYDSSSPRRRLSSQILTTSRKFREVRDVTKKNLLSMKQVFRLIEEEARVVIHETSSSSSPRKTRKRVKKIVILPDKVEDVEVDRALEIVLTATRIRRGRHGAFAIKELINLAIFIVSSLQSGRYKSLEKNLRAAMDMFCGNDDTMMMTKSMGDNTTRTRGVLFSLLDPNVANRERETKLANRGKRKTFKPCIRLSANGTWLGTLASKVVRAPLPSSVFDLVTIPDRDCRVRFKHQGRTVLRGWCVGDDCHIIESKEEEMEIEQNQDNILSLEHIQVGSLGEENTVLLDINGEIILPQELEDADFMEPQDEKIRSSSTCSPKSLTPPSLMTDSSEMMITPRSPMKRARSEDTTIDVSKSSVGCKKRRVAKHIQSKGRWLLGNADVLSKENGTYRVQYDDEDNTVEKVSETELRSMLVLPQSTIETEDNSSNSDSDEGYNINDAIYLFRFDDVSWQIVEPIRRASTHDVRKALAQTDLAAEMDWYRISEEPWWYVRSCNGKSQLVRLSPDEYGTRWAKIKQHEREVVSVV